MTGTDSKARCSRALSVSAAVLPGVGCAALALLLWGLLFRLDVWAAWQFVLPIWVAVASALAGTGCAWFSSRTGCKPRARGLRVLLWFLVSIVLLWAWFPPAERLVGWWIRQVTMLRFG